MQRSVHSDRHTITVKQEGKNKKHVVFDFTSKVIDFFTILPKKKQSEDDDEEKDEKAKTTTESPEALVVLAEEELIAIDLTDPDWKMMALPYLVSLHASAVSIVMKCYTININRLKY